MTCVCCLDQSRIGTLLSTPLKICGSKEPLCSIPQKWSRFSLYACILSFFSRTRVHNIVIISTVLLLFLRWSNPYNPWGLQLEIKNVLALIYLIHIIAVGVIQCHPFFLHSVQWENFLFFLLVNLSLTAGYSKPQNHNPAMRFHCHFMPLRNNHRQSAFEWRTGTSILLYRNLNKIMCNRRDECSVFFRWCCYTGIHLHIQKTKLPCGPGQKKTHPLGKCTGGYPKEIFWLWSFIDIATSEAWPGSPSNQNMIALAQVPEDKLNIKIWKHHHKRSHIKGNMDLRPRIVVEGKPPNTWQSCYTSHSSRDHRRSTWKPSDCPFKGVGACWGAPPCL